MSYPTPYERDFGFQSYADIHPGIPAPGHTVDSEYDAVSQAVTDVVNFLKLSIRSDGKLLNGSVGVDALAADLKLGFKVPTTWAVSTSYVVADTVWYGSAFYTCITAHTSGASFNPGFWSLIADFGAAAVAYTTAAATSAAAAGVSAATASTAAATVTASVNQRAAFTDTLAAAKALYGALVVVPNGHIMLVAGRTVVSDGYGGPFAYKSSDTTTTFVSDGLGFVDAQGRRWFRINIDLINAKWFNVTGNGSTDDTVALRNWQAVLSTNVAARGFWPAGNYKVSGTIIWGGNILGAGSDAVQIITTAGFADSTNAVFDVNVGATGGGHTGMKMEGLTIDMRLSGASITSCGSSSTHGAGGNSNLFFDDILVAGSSLTTAAFQMGVATLEAGAFIGMKVGGIRISAPIPVYIGFGQNDIEFDSLWVDNAGGGADRPLRFEGSNIDIVNLTMEMHDIAGTSAYKCFVYAGPGPVTINGWFLEGQTNIANVRWPFMVQEASPVQSRFKLLDGDLNVNYTGAHTDQAIVYGEITTATNNGQSIVVDGLYVEPGTTPWDTIFNLKSASAAALKGPLYLNVRGYDQIGNFTKMTTGSTTNTNSCIQAQGWWRGTVLNHSSPAPAAGTRCTFTWNLPAASFTA